MTSMAAAPDNAEASSALSCRAAGLSTTGESGPQADGLAGPLPDPQRRLQLVALLLALGTQLDIDRLAVAGHAVGEDSLGRVAVDPREVVLHVGLGDRPDARVLGVGALV